MLKVESHPVGSMLELLAPLPYPTVEKVHNSCKALIGPEWLPVDTGRDVKRRPLAAADTCTHVTALGRLTVSDGASARVRPYEQLTFDRALAGHPPPATLDNCSALDKGN